MDITSVLRQRDRQSFDWLYGQYAGMLFGILRKIVEENTIAERLLHETFVEAWKSLDKFDGKTGDLFIWMLRIARAKAAGYVRPGDQQNQLRGKNKIGARTRSAQQRPTGQKQYSI